MRTISPSVLGVLLLGQPGTDAEVERLWTALGKEDPATALATAGELAARPGKALALLGRELKPVSRPRPAEMRGLIADLDSSRFAVREKAARALLALGEDALPTLRQVLASSPPLEVRRRAEDLIGRIEQPSVLSAQQVREVRAVQVLERIGTAEARELLRRLADGIPSARLTQEAQAALERLARTPATGK